MEKLGWSRQALAIVGGVGAASIGLIAGGIFGVRGAPGWAMAGAGLCGLGLLAAGVTQMRQVDLSGWTITWDIPEALQFGAYVGREEQFTFGEPAAAATVAEREWRRWWINMPERIFAHQSAVDDMLHAEVGLSPGALVHSLGVGGVPGADAPNFPSLGSQPTLQALCRSHWPGFAAEWATTKPAIISRMGRQGAAVREERIVRASARAAGKPTAAPFLLRLDFVQWPAAYRELRSRNHVLLGVDYLAADSAERLRAVIRAAVVELV